VILRESGCCLWLYENIGAYAETAAQNFENVHFFDRRGGYHPPAKSVLV